MNDSGDDDDNCSDYNNEDDEVQVITPTKVSVNGVKDTLTLRLTMNTETRFADQLQELVLYCREDGRLVQDNRPLNNISRAELFICTFYFVYIH